MSLQTLATDFRNLNPHDPSAWPVAPRIAVLVGIFALAMLAGWGGLWREQLDELGAKEQEEAGLKQQFLDKKKESINLESYREQLAEIDRTFGVLLKQLPNKSEMEALLKEVNQAGSGHGQQFELFRPDQEQIKDFYAELPVAIKISGAYHDIGAFAADIGKMPRIVTLNDIALAPMKDGSLALDATIKTFRYLDEEEIANQKKEAAAAKKGAKK